MTGQESLRRHWTKVTGKNAGICASSDGFEKQAEMMRTWRGAAGRSKCGQRRPEKLDRRQSTAVYGGPAVMWSAPIVGWFWSRDPRAGGVRRPDTSVPFRVCLCIKTRSHLTTLYIAVYITRFASLPLISDPPTLCQPRVPGFWWRKTLKPGLEK